ncbi:glycosyltransferase family 2 protein [bacterium]|nr:MAG: glycosyltransferase family 2 protein [bacterium]
MLSVLIVNWNTRDLLRACLLSLRAHPYNGEMEIIVVDNASTDGSAEMVRTEFPEVSLVASQVNTGYAKGNNLAFERATGDLLLTLNPDTEVSGDALDHAADALARHPRAGALGVRLVGTNGRTQSSVRGFPTVLGILGDILKIRSGPFDSYRLARFDYEKEGPAPQPMGTFLLFRREALAAIGDPKAPFDEGFPIFFNEVDLLKRLDNAGWPTIYTPNASVLHHGGESTKQVRKAMIWESHRSLIRYLKKHRGTGLGALALPLVAAAIYGAAFVRARGVHAGFRPQA